MKLFKKMLVLLLVLSMVMALVACGDDDDDDDSKEGSSRKKDKTEQVTKEPTDDPDPTDTPDPTDAPDPTDEPTPIPTAEPVSTPTPTPTEAPAPTDAPNPISGDLTADKLIGTWQGSMTVSLKDFMVLSDGTLNDETQQVFDQMMSSMNDAGIKGDFKLDLIMEFKDDKNCVVTMKADGMDFYNGMQKLLTTEESAYAFWGAMLKTDKDGVKAYFALLGMSLDEAADYVLSLCGGPAAFNAEESKETQYKIEDNKVKITGEDALGYFTYDAAKGGLVIGTDDTSADSQKIVKLLSGIVLKKK